MKAICLILFATLSTPVLADLYQWKDESGRVHFSDTKPGSAGNTAPAVTTLKKPEPPRPSGAAASDAGRSSNRLTPAERQQRVLQVMKQESDQREQEKLNAATTRHAREAECSSLRTRQSNMDGRRLFRRASEDEGGGIHYMDDAERAEYEQRLSAAIAEKCK